MKVMVLVKASPQSEADVMPSEQLMTEMGRFNEELAKAGLLLAADGLQPSSKGVRVRFSGKSRSVTDGPFAEAKELVAGFWLWKVKSMEEAVEWVKRCPNPMNDDSDIEIRPLFELEDLVAVMTPDHLERRERLQRQLDGGSPAPAPTRLETAGELVIAGFKETYTAETRVNIPAQWTRFAPHLGKIRGQVGTTAYGVCLMPQPASGFDYLTGVEVTDVAGLPPEFTHVRLPAARYAVFVHRDHVSSLAQTIDAIATQWLPGSGFDAPAAPCFERYTAEFNPQTGRGGMEISDPHQRMIGT